MFFDRNRLGFPMEYKDYYQTLGISRSATADEIKQAYRRLARKFHPDVSRESDAERHFKEINEAREVLGDTKKRATYDALGSRWEAGQEYRPPPGSRPRNHREFRFEADHGGQFSDFFSSLFGSRGGPHRAGEQQDVKVQITLEEAYAGITRHLHLDLPEPDLRGRLRGRPRILKVRIPAGVTQGQRIRLAGQGSSGVLGRPKGDLYLQMDILPHTLFQLDARHLTLHLPVTPWEAALGALVPVPTLAGTVNLRIPEGAQSGTRLRLKGRGLPGDPAGDLYVVLEIHIPPAHGKTARDLYQRMAELLPFDPRADLGRQR
jgi:curved DNA-binding protein